MDIDLEGDVSLANSAQGYINHISFDKLFAKAHRELDKEAHNPMP
jgi:hypothetical protein